MAEKMKVITCCGDCVYYNWKKHKCSRGAGVETDARNHFYDDCPLPDIPSENEIRAKAIEEFAEKMKELFKHIKVADSVIDMVVKEMKGE